MALETTIRTHMRWVVLFAAAVIFSTFTPLTAARHGGSGAAGHDGSASHGVSAKARHGPSVEDTCVPNSRDARTHGGGKARFVIPVGIATSVWDDGTVSMAIPVQNVSERLAPDVIVTDVFVSSGLRLEPTSFPIPLGDMAPEETQAVDAIYELPRIGPGTKYRVMVAGHYTMFDQPCNFRVKSFITPQRVDDTSPISTEMGTVQKQDPSTAIYPPAPAPVSEEPNAESPILIPIGPERQLFPPTPDPTDTEGAGAPLIIENTSITNAGVPPDPSAARGIQDVVLATYNTGISHSVDGGMTFTDVNLNGPEPGNPSRTSFFPQSDGGLCCDQIVIYVPEQNLFVWLLQYWPLVNTTPTTSTITQPNRLRIAWATPEAIQADFWNAWTYGDLTANSVSGVSDGLGVASNEWLDYPDLAYSDSFLYVSIDHGSTRPGGVYTGRRIVARLDLADMADPSAGVVHYDFTELTGASGLNKSHFIQGAPDRMVIAGLKDTSTLRIFTWRDARSSVGSWSMPISSITTNYTSVAPDGTDWYAVSFPGNITGGTYNQVTDEYLFAFNGGQDSANGRPRAYVRIESAENIPFLPNVYVASSEYDVWNSNYAFAMAALGAQGSDIGMALAVGGGTLGYPDFAVGLKGEFVVQEVTNSNATQGNRFGDYLPCRLIPGTSDFATEVYTVQTGAGGGGAQATMRYVEFGREIILF